MKYYVIFNNEQYHKLGPIQLGPKSIAVFDVDSVETGSGIVKEIFGTNQANHSNWDLDAIKDYRKNHDLHFVDINSEI